MVERTPARSRLPLHPRHQLASAILTMSCLSVMAISWGLQYYRRGRVIDIDRPFDVPAIDFKIDVNQANWPELTLLPDISETMARRIVEYRNQHGPFARLSDLEDVSGIGPRTRSRIQPYLLPIVPAKPVENVASDRS